MIENKVQQIHSDQNFRKGKEHKHFTNRTHKSKNKETKIRKRSQLKVNHNDIKRATRKTQGIQEEFIILEEMETLQKRQDERDRLLEQHDVS